MNAEYQQALGDLERARENYNVISSNFEGVAYHQLKAAEERVMSFIREVKENERKTPQGQS